MDWSCLCLTGFRKSQRAVFAEYLEEKSFSLSSTISFHIQFCDNYLMQIWYPYFIDEDLDSEDLSNLPKFRTSGVAGLEPSPVFQTHDFSIS